MAKTIDKAIQNIVDMVQEESAKTKSKVDGIKGVTARKISKKKNEAKNIVSRGTSEIESKKQQKIKEVQQYRREASRLASMANKRIQRLERNNFKDSPAYQGYIASGGGKFSVKGKDYNELQSEVARMRAFINANTSTVTGVNNYLKNIATNTGIKYSNMKDLHAKAGKFFELSNKVEEYLRTVEDMASAIGYQKIWEAVNTYTKSNRIDLSKANVDIDGMIKSISDALTEHQKPENISIRGGFLETEKGLAKSAWFKLPKD